MPRTLWTIGTVSTALEGNAFIRAVDDFNLEGATLRMVETRQGDFDLQLHNPEKEIDSELWERMKNTLEGFDLAWHIFVDMLKGVNKADLQR